MVDIYYTIEDEEGNSWDANWKVDAIKLAKRLEVEGHKNVHVFFCRDDEYSEPVVVKTIY